MRLLVASVHTESQHRTAERAERRRKRAEAEATARARAKFDAIDADGSGAIDGAEIETLARWVLDSFKPEARTMNLARPLSK